MQILREIYLLMRIISILDVAVSGTVGAAVGSFVGGVLLTAVIGGVIAVAVFCRAKKEPAEQEPVIDIW